MEGVAASAFSVWRTGRGSTCTVAVIPAPAANDSHLTMRDESLPENCPIGVLMNTSLGTGSFF
jgi:hypothetical protein